MAAIDKIKLKSEASEFFQKGKFDKALETYRKLIAVDRRDDRSMIRIAECYRKLKKTKECIAAYKQVAAFYSGAGFLLKAVSIYKQILDIEPGNADALGELNALNEKRGIRIGGPAEAAAGGEIDLQEAEQELEVVEMETTVEATPAPKPAAPPPPPRPAPAAAPPPPAPGAGGGPGLMGKQLPGNIPLFSDLTPEEFSYVINTCSIRPIKARTRVIEEGEMGNSMFVLVTGEVLVYRHDEKGNTIKITTLKDGSFFGEFALLSDAKRHASVGATTDCELLEITRDHLTQITAKFPRVGEVLNEFYKKRILATLLLTSPLFQPLSIDDRKQLVTKFVMLKAAPNENILEEGGPGDGLYLIKSGEVEILIHDKEGAEVTITYLTEGAFFGEISLIKHSPCTATVRTSQDTILLKLPKEAFNDVIMTHPQVLELINEYVEERQRETSETKTSINSIAQGGMI